MTTEAIGNSWNILNAISGHKYHQNQTKASAVLVVIEQWK